MLKFPFSKDSIVCDLPTKKQIGGLCEFEDFGENFVKGKVKPVQIFGIQKFGPPERDNRISLLSVEKSNDFIGYKSEIERASKFIDDWTEAPNHHLLLISGASGVGKSFFCKKLHKTMTIHGVSSW
jgi:transcriptional regulator with PAS, ATPase and Fis domain